MNPSTPFVTAAACLLIAGSASAHVVPPEKLHPVAEAYRRATFVLNLNPVVWQQVSPDVATIADHWRSLDVEAAEAFDSAAGEIVALATSEPPRLLSREAAAELFCLLTVAVNRIGQGKLALAREDLGSRTPVRLMIREAQGVFAAYDDTLRAADPEGFRHLGTLWLEMSSALGAAGLLGEGEVAVDRPRYSRAEAGIRAYMNKSFGADFRPLEGRALAPWPAGSITFDPPAALPPALPPGSDINKQLPRPRQILNMAARGVDEHETALIALGDMAFDSPFILGSPADAVGISCNTCHNKSITNPGFFVPGLSARSGGVDVSNGYFAPHANNGRFDPLDIPDLRGIRFTGPYGRNGRFSSLREFVRNVIVNEFDGPEPDALLLDGMVAYMFEFDFLPNPGLDRNGSLTDRAPAAARRGEVVFNRPFAGMGGASCATCHVPSANFVDHLRHDIGTAGAAEPFARDGALDTPTLLGIAYTAPYFHDGSRPTLRAVNEWFNTSFGLGLTEPELGDLTAYLEAVGAGADAYEDTTFTLAAEMEEFSFFLSAFETLAAKRRPQLMEITFRTIAFEIRAHKWDLQDWTHMPVLEGLADLMDQAAAAVARRDERAVNGLVRQYRALYEKHKDLLI